MDNLRKIGQNVTSVAQQGAQGYQTGRSHGQTAAGLLGSFDSHMNRANMDALSGRPHPHDIFVRKYATNKHAGQLADYYRRTNPVMGGPRTAAWYSHYYGVSVPGATGTEGQMALLRHVARQQEHIQAIRNSPEPRGAYHNADSTATDTRPGIHRPLTPIYEPPPQLPRDVAGTEEIQARMAAARARLPRPARQPAIQPSSIPGFPSSETWPQRQRRLAREQGVRQPAAPRY